MSDTIKTQMVLDKVQVFLCQWLDCHLRRVCQTNFWQSAVLGILTPEQRSNVEEEGAQSLEDLDFALLVAVFLGNFRILRREVHLNSELFDMAKHVKKIRNLYAHKDSRTITKPNYKKIKYHIETLHQFLDGLGADVELLREIDELGEASMEGGLHAYSDSQPTIITSNGVKIRVSSRPTVEGANMHGSKNSAMSACLKANARNDMAMVKEMRSKQLPK